MSRSKSKAKSRDPYISDSRFLSILYFQNLISKDPRGVWSSFVSSTELRFIYDMVSSSNSFRDFTMSTRQSKWLYSLQERVKLQLKGHTKPQKTKTSTRSRSD